MQVIAMMSQFANPFYIWWDFAWASPCFFVLFGRYQLLNILASTDIGSFLKLIVHFCSQGIMLPTYVNKIQKFSYIFKCLDYFINIFRKFFLRVRQINSLNVYKIYFEINLKYLIFNCCLFYKNLSYSYVD
jgi:hypothetical protein